MFNSTEREYNCKKCSNHDNSRMVQCEKCDEWYHFNCVCVDSGISEADWNCPSCETSSTMLSPQTPLSREAAALLKQAPIQAASPLRAEDKKRPSDVPGPSSVRATQPNTHNYPAIVSPAPQPAVHTAMSATSTCGVNHAPLATSTMATWNAATMPAQPPSATCASATLTSKAIFNVAETQNPACTAAYRSPDNTVRQCELQLAMLDEERRAHAEYLNKKYTILAASGMQHNSTTGLTNNPLFSVVGPTPAQLAARQAISKDLPHFHGDPEEWPLFISAFETSTEIAGYSNAENLMRLQSCIKGKAREMVNSKLLLPAMVPEVIRTLKMCFGRPEFIIESMIEKARKMQLVRDKLESIIEFSLCVRSICSTMEACHLDAHLNNPMLVKELIGKLPTQYKLSWAMHAKDASVPVVKDFSEWLYQIAEAASTVTSPIHRRNATLNTHTQVKEAFARASCAFCKVEGHKISKCHEFENIPLKQRWQVVAANNLCRTCLGAHRRKCFVKTNCGVDNCNSKHHKLLHHYAVSPNARPIFARNEQVNSHHNLGNKETIYFRIVPVQLRSKTVTIDTYAFLDEGSSVTLLQHDLYNSLHLEGVEQPLCLKWTGDTTRSEDNSVKTSVEIANVESGNKYVLKDVYTVENLGLPKQTVNFSELQKIYPHLNGLRIGSYTNAQPKILIGANNWKLAVPLKIHEGAWNQPIAVKSRLGWALQGGSSNRTRNVQLNIHTCECKQQYEELHESVKEYFSLESTKASTLMSREDERAISILNTTCRKVDNQYETGLLWRAPDQTFPDSYTTAARRMACLYKRLEKDANMNAMVQERVRNLLAKGYARKLSSVEIASAPERVWYLPIFVTSNPNKPGKFRLVWDAAAKTDGVSLNDFVLSGPDFLHPLMNILLAFREGQVAICGDIEEMFHRINVREEDIHAQRFLWWDDNDQPNKPSVFVMRALSFGISCAPCIAHYVRDKNAEQFKDKYPRATEAIQKYHYMDDFIDSTNSAEDALTLATQVKQIHAAAGFHMRNWSSNAASVVEKLREQLPCQRAVEWCSTEKILGMYWEPNNDVFKYNFRFAKLRRNVIQQQITPTKREILQVLMSIFDPLGILSPFTIGMKILLQDIWRSGMDWDDELSEALQTEWLHCKTAVQQISEISVPRCYSPLLKDATDIQLHTFTDAGEYGYCAVCYLRVRCGSQVSVTLVAAKSRVSPLKPLSIPRLELQAAVVGVRLATKVTQALRLRINSTWWWSDSVTVLRWLYIDPRKFQQFVMYRVGEILEHSDVKQWKWVPSKLNPADLATKARPQCGTAAWFTGPDYLANDTDTWPKRDDLGPGDNSELRHVLHITPGMPRNVQINVEDFSDWRCLYRAVATFYLYVARLQAIAHSELKPKYVSFEMLEKAKRFLIKQAQADEFSDEICQLLRDKDIARGSKLIALNVHLDVDSILRIHGRAEQLSCNNAIVLPNNHYITFLIVRYFHTKLHHASHETAIAQTRAQFYIPRLRALYKKVRKLCQSCCNSRVMPCTPQMSPLPKARLACFERPFTYVGIDFFGPLLVAVGRRQEKRWGVIFTCLTTRAVHTEVACSLDTCSCIMCIRNFTSRRGTPREIYTDNGTNFKAAEKIICDVEFSVIEAKFDEIKWYYNPPAAPHMGGAWERLIRSIKSVLLKICPSMKFTDESLRSSLCEVEFILNSRPLTFVSLDSEDDEAITPNHLLLGSSGGYKPISNEESSLRKRWQQTQLFADRFWSRWLQEYAPTLTRRSKWFTKTPPISVGSVVVVVDGKLSRNCWPKGIVVDVIQAKDGQVRRVSVRTKDGILQHPVTKVAVLDVGTV